MPAELQNLDTIFNSRVFRIPDYQRGYAWGDDQLKDFWDDLDSLRETLKNSATPILDQGKSIAWPFLQLRFRLFSVCP